MNIKYLSKESIILQLMSDFFEEKERVKKIAQTFNRPFFPSSLKYFESILSKHEQASQKIGGMRKGRPSDENLSSNFC